jgi:hypothetical protein
MTLVLSVMNVSPVIILNDISALCHDICLSHGSFSRNDIICSRNDL